MFNRWVGRLLSIILTTLIFTACGPETIFVRPSLNTSERHTANGQALLEQEKYQDALREFKYASELDPRNLEALIGLAETLGNCNDMPQALSIMQRAEKLATTAPDQAKVQAGYTRLRDLRSGQ